MRRGRPGTLAAVPEVAPPAGDVRRPAGGSSPLGAAARRVRPWCGAAGYGLIITPTFEDLAVFQRVGESTDVVRKEMYDFEDKGGRHIALRPEMTASVARAFIEHRPTHRGRPGTPGPTSATSGPRPGDTGSSTRSGSKPSAAPTPISTSK